MRYVSGLIKIVLFVLLLSFAIKNSDPVVLQYYLGYQWHAPLVLVILLAFTLGAATGVTACMSYLYRQRKSLHRLQAELLACRNMPLEKV